MDPTDYMQFVLALVFVLGLIGLTGVILKRYGPGSTAAYRMRGGARRLKIIESLPLDPRRRLLLIRRDGKEHLLLLGPQSDCVVEADIDPPEGTLQQEESISGDGVVQRLDAVVRRIGSRRTISAATPEKREDNE